MADNPRDTLRQENRPLQGSSPPKSPVSGSSGLTERNLNVPRQRFGEAPHRKFSAGVSPSGGIANESVRPGVFTVAQGGAIATIGSIPYDESPLDLTIGLHCSRENSVIEYRSPGEPIVERFSQVEKAFRNRCPSHIQAWLQLSICDPYLDRVLYLESPGKRVFVAVFMDDLEFWNQIQSLVRDLCNEFFPDIFLPLRYYQNLEIDLSARRDRGNQGQEQSSQQSSSNVGGQENRPGPERSQGNTQGQATQSAPSSSTSLRPSGLMNSMYAHRPSPYNPPAQKPGSRHLPSSPVSIPSGRSLTSRPGNHPAASGGHNLRSATVQSSSTTSSRHLPSTPALQSTVGSGAGFITYPSQSSEQLLDDPLERYSVPLILSTSPEALRRRYSDGFVIPTQFSNRSGELPQKVQTRSFWRDVLNTEAESFVGMSIGTKEGEEVGSVGAVVCLKDLNTGEYITDSNGNVQPMLLSNDHVLRKQERKGQTTQILFPHDAAQLPEGERIIVHLPRRDCEQTFFSMTGRMRQQVQRLNEITEQAYLDPESQAFQALDNEMRAEIEDNTFIGYHLAKQHAKDLVTALDPVSLPHERVAGRLYLSSGRYDRHYGKEFEQVFKGVVGSKAPTEKQPRPFDVDYCLTAVEPGLYAHCHNRICVPFPENNYPAEFEDFRSYTKIRGFSKPEPKTVVMKAGRGTGITFGMIMPDRRPSKRHGSRTTYEVYANPLDQGVFAIKGDSGSGVVDKNGGLVGIMSSGEADVGTKPIRIAYGRTPPETDIPRTTPVTPIVGPGPDNPVDQVRPTYRPVNIMLTDIIQEDLAENFGLTMELYDHRDNLLSEHAEWFKDARREGYVDEESSLKWETLALETAKAMGKEIDVQQIRPRTHRERGKDSKGQGNNKA